MRAHGRTPSVVDTHGHTLALHDVCRVIGIGYSTAKRQLAAGTFPLPALPRRVSQPYRFAAIAVDRYLSRAS